MRGSLCTDSKRGPMSFERVALFVIDVEVWNTQTTHSYLDDISLLCGE